LKEKGYGCEISFDKEKVMEWVEKAESFIKEIAMVISAKTAE
jgi:hypothetical protein